MTRKSVGALGVRRTAVTSGGSARAVFPGHDRQDPGSDDGHASGEDVERREEAAPPRRLPRARKKLLL